MSAEELLRYAGVNLSDGLDKEWRQALLKVLEQTIEHTNAAAREQQAQEQLSLF